LSLQEWKRLIQIPVIANLEGFRWEPFRELIQIPVIANLEGFNQVQFREPLEQM